MYISSQCMQSFSDLERWVTELPNQTQGLQQAICETGQPYREFFAGALARENDRAIIESVVASQMYTQLCNYFQNRLGTIYWRIPLETDTRKNSMVLRIDKNGPDTDFITGEKCFKDHDWWAIRAYCRLYRSESLSQKVA
jgi:hypothetical protein